MVLVPLVANQAVAAVSIDDQIDSVLVLYIEFVSVEIAEHSKLSRMIGKNPWLQRGWNPQFERQIWSISFFIDTC